MIVVMEKRKKVYTLLILSVAWAILIFVLCALPSNDLPNVKIPYFDKIAHFGIFFIQSVLLSLLFDFQTRKSYFKIIFLSTLLVFVYGGFIEILQGNIFSRSGDIYDLIADILGGFLGAIAYPTVLRFYYKFIKKGR